MSEDINNINYSLYKLYKKYEIKFIISSTLLRNLILMLASLGVVLSIGILDTGMVNKENLFTSLIIQIIIWSIISIFQLIISFKDLKKRLQKMKDRHDIQKERINKYLRYKKKRGLILFFFFLSEYYITT